MSEDVVAIYCRLSDEDKDKAQKGDDSESIQNQKLLLTDYANKQGWRIYDIYTDDDLSGVYLDRQDFRRMISDARRGWFNIILCKTQSRFSREVETIEKYLYNQFPLLGIRFVSVVDNIDTDVKSSKKASQIYALINEWYCSDTSDSIRAVFKRKMEVGQFLGPAACYGYVKDPNDKHKLIIDEEPANVVKEIFQMYLQGYGCSKIAACLTERGVPTPAMHKKISGIMPSIPNADKYSVPYGIWACNTVRKILQDKTYLGCVVQGKERKVSYKSKKIVRVPKEEWVVVPNCHEPIIDEKSFYTVQSLIDNKRTIHKPAYGYKGTRDSHLFAGKLRCHDCGTNMHRGTPCRDGKTYYLRCNLSHKTKSRECTPHSISLGTLTSVVESRIREIIDSYINDKDTLEAIKKSIADMSGVKKEITKKQRELCKLDKKVADNQIFIMELYKDKVRGVLSEDEFVNMKRSMQQEVELCKTRKTKLYADINDLDSKYASLENAEAVIERYANFETLTHEIVNDFIDYIEIGEKNENSEQEVFINWMF